jgi:signal-transduction protein with cAMP-binding, CBS, and nucleotidyltransferase domain
MVEFLADTRPICGDPTLAQEVIDIHRRLLASLPTSEPFRQLATEVAAMPVALGLFGRFRTVRSGANRGGIPLTEQVLAPLCNVIRVLAIACGAGVTGTRERIRQVMVVGAIGVTLAESIDAAFIYIAGERIRLELAADQSGDELFLNPDELAEEKREQLHTGLEYVTTLQRLAYQQLVEAGRR